MVKGQPLFDPARNNRHPLGIGGNRRRPDLPRHQRKIGMGRRPAARVAGRGSRFPSCRAVQGRNCRHWSFRRACAAHRTQGRDLCWYQAPCVRCCGCRATPGARREVGDDIDQPLFRRRQSAIDTTRIPIRIFSPGYAPDQDNRPDQQRSRCCNPPHDCEKILQVMPVGLLELVPSCNPKGRAVA